jgi:hypothetical protein
VEQNNASPIIVDVDGSGYHLTSAENGVTNVGELHSLAEFGVRRISVNYREDQKVDQFGNLFRYRVAINDASKDHRTYDVFLRFLKKPGI